MRKHARQLWLAVMGLVLFAGGCNLQDGWEKGLTDGVSAAVAAVIKTPVQIWVDETFKNE